MARIALIDDHAFLRRGVEAALTEAGHEVVLSSAGGLQTEDLIQQVSAELVILDYSMPIQGTDILERLRAGGLKLPVIFLVNELPDHGLLAIMRLRVEGIVFKHAPEGDLFDAIDAVIAGRRYIEGSLIDKSIAIASMSGASADLPALTEREKAVAKLAAGGLRNREIGERLNMTEGTVKLHLHHVYRKLGIGNRTSLAVLLTNTE